MHLLQTIIVGLASYASISDGSPPCCPKTHDSCKTSVPKNETICPENGKCDMKNMPLLENPDSKRNVPQLVASRGYHLETHTVKTSDGYLLTVHRIPCGKTENVRTCKTNPKPVLIAHGFLLDSSCFVINFENSSLGYILADNGYDVWMLNMRGAYYSEANLVNGSKGNHYWDFSWHENGYFDIPATIDYILNNTSKPKVHLIGHSMGGTAITITLSTRPEYQDKVTMVVALAPAVFWGCSKFPLIKLCDLVELVLPPGKFVLSNSVFNKLGAHCGLLSPACADGLQLIFGKENKCYFDEKRVSVILSKFPGSGSNKQLIHFCQVAQTGKFQYFKTNKTCPDEYPMKKILTPFLIFAGTNDLLLAYSDQVKLSKELVNAEIIPIIEYSHLDFCYAKNPRQDYVNEMLIRMDV